ncbi:MAG: hypothetical protein EOM08_04785 [Clostridia bacterium]|nr:hypothetical protein [Clostridia bacterium]NCC75729.1 hypothetical protein [Clostridia bacterium]
MELHTVRMSIQLSDRAVSRIEPVPTALPELDKQTQILGYILSDPKIAREELAIFALCLDMARRKARAGGLKQGAFFCGLDPKKHPCHPDDPPDRPLRLLPCFSLSRLLIDYYRTSLDFQFLLSGGADVVFETARLWQAIQMQGIASDPGEWPDLKPLVQLNLNWTSRIWTLLGRAGRQQDVAARLGLSGEEVRQLAESPVLLPDRTQSSQTKDAATLLANLVHTGYDLSPEKWSSGEEAGVLAILATQIARLEIEDDELSFAPVLPAGWQGYSLRLSFRGSQFDLSVDQSAGRMVLIEGSAIPVLVYGLEYMLEDECVFDLKQVGDFAQESIARDALSD